MLIVEWSCVLALRWRPLGELSPFNVELGGLWFISVLNSALPPQRRRPDTRPEHQDPVSHMAQKIREKERKRERGREGGREGGRELLK